MRSQILKLWWCLLASATLLSAQPLPERRPLKGRVTQTDGKPIAGAVVMLARDLDQGGFSFWGGQAVTDANGYFSFPDADEDSYRIAVEAPGFDGQDQKQFVLDSALAPLVIVLQRLADIKLRFLKPDGTPLSNSSIVFRMEGETARSPAVRKMTDDKGEYLLKDQKPGRYRFQVVAPDTGYAVIDDLNVAYEQVPKLIDVRLKRGGTLRLTASGTNPTTQSMQPLGGAILSLGPASKVSAEDRAAGRITRPEETNLQSLYAWSPDGSGAATRDGDGVLELTDLPPGRYTARLLLSSSLPSAWQDVEVKSGGTSTLDFVFSLKRAPTSLEILVRDKKGQPVPNTDWNLQLRLLDALAVNATPFNEALPPLPNGELVNEPVVEPMGLISNFSIRRARSDEAGRFVLFPLQPGRWRVLLISPRDSKNERDRGTNYQKDIQVAPTGSSITFDVNTSK